MGYFRNIILLMSCILIISGCGNTDNEPKEIEAEKPEVNEEVITEKAKEEETSVKTEDSQIKKGPIDLKDILSLDKNGIIEILGTPEEIYESDSGDSLIYNDLSVTLDNSQKLSNLEFMSTEYLLNGIAIGHMPDDVRKQLGKPTSEGISESGDFFELVYDTVISENQTNTSYFASSDYRSPIDYISYSKTDTTPLFTTEEVKGMLLGSWVNEEDMMNGDYSDLIYFTETKMITGSFNGTIGGLARLYNVLNYDTIELTGINSYSDFENEKFESYTLEVSSDGESIKIYQVDSYTGEIFQNSLLTLYKYSDSIVTK